MKRFLFNLLEALSPDRGYFQNPLAKRIATQLMALIPLLGYPGLAASRNADISLWTQNLSESALDTELAERDFNPEIVVAGSTVHVLWMTNDKNGSDIDALVKVFYRRSTDGGRHWEPKRLVYTSPDSDWVTGRMQQSDEKRMTVEGDYVHVAFALDYQYGATPSQIIYIRSTDSGASFESPRILAEHPASNLWHLGDTFVVTSEGKLSIGYHGSSNWQVNNDFRILSSNDHGDSFTEQVAYSQTSGSSWGVHDMLRKGDHIYVLYTDSYYYYGMVYGRLYLAASSDAGVHFTQTLISVPSKSGEHKAGGLQDYHYVPKMAAVGDTVGVIWQGLDADDIASVFFRRSTDAGLTFDSAVNLTHDGLPEGESVRAGHETLAMGSDVVHTLFLSNSGRVYHRRSIDGGASFQAARELTGDSNTPTDDAWGPMIALDQADPSGRRLAVFWSRPAFVRSTDGGATFTAPLLATPYFSYNGGSTRRAYMAAGADGGLHLVAQGQFYVDSWGFTDDDIFYRRLAPAAAAALPNRGLRLESDPDDRGARYDNLQIAASSDVNFTSAMTAELWVKPAAGGVTTGSTSQTKPVLHKLNQTQSYNYAYALATRDSYGARQALAQITTTQGSYWLAPASPTVGLLEDGDWSHLALTYDAAAGADNYKLYLNGELIASTRVEGELSTGDGALWAGYFGNWDIDELRLWSGARTASQLRADMWHELTGREAGLRAYYNFNGSTRDVTGHGNDGILMYQEQFAAGRESTDCQQGPVTLSGERLLSGVQRIRSETSLSTSGTVAIDATATVAFEAGQSIALGPYFHAPPGARFLARIDAVDCSLDQDASADAQPQLAGLQPVQDARASDSPLSQGDVLARLDARLALMGRSSVELRDLMASADGGQLVFSTPAALLPDDTNGVSDVYRYQAGDDSLWLVSRGADGGPANGASDQPRIDGPGRFIVYRSLADNLSWLPDTNGVADIYRQQLTTGSSLLASWTQDGEQGAHTAAHPDLSDDAQAVVFDRRSEDGEARGIYLHTPGPANFSQRLDSGDCDAHHPSISSDGRFIVYICGDPSDPDLCRLRFAELETDSQAEMACARGATEDDRILLDSDGAGVSWQSAAPGSSALETWIANPLVGAVPDGQQGR